MRNLTPHRRRAAVLAACCAAIAPSTILLRHNGASTSRPYTILGMVTGMLVGGAIVLWRKRQGAC